MSLTDKESFKTVDRAARLSRGKISVPDSILQQWKSKHLVRRMLELMAPLVAVQDSTLRTFGMGATGFHNEIHRMQDDGRVYALKAKLEETMRDLQDAASAYSQE